MMRASLVLLVACALLGSAIGVENEKPRAHRKRTGFLSTAEGSRMRNSVSFRRHMDEFKERVEEDMEREAERHQPHHKKVLGLLRWNWKQATDESKVEWGIVLKRFFMVNMMLTDLGRQFGHIMEKDPVTGLVNDHGDLERALPWMREKYAKLTHSLKEENIDQDTDTFNFKRMATDKQLSAAQKKMLTEEHEKEQKGEQLMMNLANVTLQHATILLKAAERKNATAASPSSESNKKATNNTAAAKKEDPPLTEAQLEKELGLFQEATVKFQESYETFEKQQQKALAKLLALGKGVVHHNMPAPVEKP